MGWNFIIPNFTFDFPNFTLDFPNFTTTTSNLTRKKRWVLSRIWREKRPTWTQPLGSWLTGWDDLFESFSGWWFQIFFIFIPIWGNDPIWRAYFSDGLKPPTSFWNCWKWGNPFIISNVCLDIWLWLNNNFPQNGCLEQCEEENTFPNRSTSFAKECGEFLGHHIIATEIVV